MFGEQNQKLLKEEMEKLHKEILEVYNASGKRTSGEFENGLEILYRDNEAVLFGYEYLAGRRAGKQPPNKSIEDWLKAKGIQPIEDKMKISTLAYLIARKIAKEGTNDSSKLKIYSQVITPARIDEILEKFDSINANAFIEEVKLTITKAFNVYT